MLAVIDSGAVNPAEALLGLGGAKVILITASGGKTVAETFKGLRIVAHVHVLPLMPQFHLHPMDCRHHDREALPRRGQVLIGPIRCEC